MERHTLQNQSVLIFQRRRSALRTAEYRGAARVSHWMILESIEC